MTFFLSCIKYSYKASPMISSLFLLNGIKKIVDIFRAILLLLKFSNLLVFLPTTNLNNNYITTSLSVSKM